MVVKCSEAATATDSHLAYVVRVVSGDGGTVRGTIGLYHATSTEFPLYPSELTRIHSARTGGATTFSSQIGDRIIVEIGLHGVTPTLSAAYLWFGDPSATADYTLTAGQASSMCPWVELSRTVSFGKTLVQRDDVSVREIRNWEFQVVGPTLIIDFTDINY
jgi:hypothetical protein